jgi:GNAT superfamily N-acetyltransferase
LGLANTPSITLRPVVPEDEEFLFHLYCTVRAPEFAYMALSEQQKMQFLLMQYKAQQSGYRTQYAESEHELVLQEDRPVGRILVACMEGEFFLVDIALLPESRNQGVGTLLVSRLQARARQAGKPVRSSVFRFNSGSLRFHQRLGFHMTAEDEIQFQMEWVPSETEKNEPKSEISAMPSSV